jgi:hypothetical protein
MLNQICLDSSALFKCSALEGGFLYLASHEPREQVVGKVTQSNQYRSTPLATVRELTQRINAIPKDYLGSEGPSF